MIEKQMDKTRKILIGIVISLAATSAWLGYVVATPSPTIGRVVTPGAIGPCTWFISLDGTTPVGEAMVGGLSVSPGDNVVGTAGQDMTAFMGQLSTSGILCFSPQTFTFNSQWPSSSLTSTTLVVGSGPSTLINPGGAANFDPINATLVQTRDFRMTDRHGIVVDFTFDSTGLDQSLQSIPLNLFGSTSTDFPGISVDLLGNYLRVDTNGLTNKFPAITSGFAVVMTNGTSATFPYHRLIVQASVRASVAASFFPFFMEPIKGEFGNFIGFEWIGPCPCTTLTMLTKVAGTATTLTASKTLDTNDHTYKIDYICCVSGVSKVTFYYDGAQQAVSTTNIYQYPSSNLGGNLGVIGPTLECCEPNGVNMAVYLKSPFIQALTKTT